MKNKILLLFLVVTNISFVFANGGIGYKGIYINNNGTKTWFKAHNVAWEYSGCTDYTFNFASDFNSQNLGSLTSTETLQISGFAVVGWTDNSDWVAGKLLYKVWKQGNTEPGTWSEIPVGNYGTYTGPSQVVCNSGNDRIVGYNNGTTNINPGAPGIYNFKIQALGQMQYSGGGGGFFNVNNGSEVTATFTITSSNSDYFRSKTTGTWGNAANWESSADNVNWGTSTLVPDLSAGSISILNGNNISIDANITIPNLTINSGGTVEVAAGKQLTVNGALSNNGTLNLLSDATGTATILTNGTVSAGTYKVNQYLSSYRSWYMSTPLTETIIPTDNNAVNPALIQSYNETNNSWPSATAIGMTAGVGYMLNPGTSPGTSTLTFTGTLNNGTQTAVSLTHTTANTAYKGFNLVGNPYPSYLDWTKVYTASTGISSSMWYRTKTIEGFKFWTVNGTSGIVSPLTATATKDIPPMQAFWVKANSGGGSFTLTNEMRSHAPSSNYLLKAPAKKSVSDFQILRLTVTDEIRSDEAVIYFNADALNSFDNYDSPKMMNGSSSLIPDIYTTAGTEELVINGMANIPYNTEIPLYFKVNASTASSFALKASEISNFEEGTPVLIKNNLTGEYQLISDGSDYTFNTSDAIADPAFSLIIKAPGTVTNVPKSENQQVFIYANDNRQMIVTCKEAGSLISVYNAVGQNIFTGKTNKTTTVIDHSFTPGVYLVNVNNVTKKVIVK